MKMLLLALTFGQSVSVVAAPYVRLDDPGFTMHHVQVRHQRSIGNCYAHAAAQFYDAWRFLLGSTDYRQSSGLEINQRYKVKSRSEDIDGGRLVEIMPRLSTEGTCAQEVLNQMFVSGTDVDAYASKVMEIYNGKRNLFYKERKAAFDKIDKDYTWFWNENDAKRKADQELRYKYLREGISLLKDYHRITLKDVFDEVRLDRIEPNKDVVGIFETIGIINCNPGFRIRAHSPLKIGRTRHTQTTYGYDVVRIPGRVPMLVPTVHKRVDPTNTMKLIHEELDYEREALPIGIGYCSAVLSEGRSFSGYETDDKRCGNHASLVIGRRTIVANPEAPKAQQRPLKQILIRNTWGTGCGNYSKDWPCYAAPDKKAGVESYHLGSVWVDEAALAKAIYETQTFDRDRY